MELNEVIPTIKRFTTTEKDKTKIKQWAEIAEILETSLEGFELQVANSQEYANMTLKQRDALHSLIKQYTKRIPDAELANALMKEANKVLKTLS